MLFIPRVCLVPRSDTPTWLSAIPGSWLLLGEGAISLTEDREGLVERRDFLAASTLGQACKGIRVGDEEEEAQRKGERKISKEEGMSCGLCLVLESHKA